MESSSNAAGDPTSCTGTRMQQQQQQQEAANNNNDMLLEGGVKDNDDIFDDTPAFINPDEAVEVHVDEDNVPMDEDDDDDDNNNNVAMMTMMMQEDEGGHKQQQQQQQKSSAAVQVQDMSVLQITSHTGPVYSVTCCQSNNNKILLVSGGGDDRAFIHELLVLAADTNSATGDGVLVQHQTTRELDKHADSVSSVALNLPYVTADSSKTPRMAAAASYDGSIAIYDPDDVTAKRLQNLEGPTDVECLAFHNKGGIVLLAGSAADGSLWMFHLVLQKCLQVFVGHQSAVTACNFTPDGKFALSASSDGTLRVWAPRTGNCKHMFNFSANHHHQPRAPPPPGLTCMAINGGSDGQLVMVGAEDGQAHVCHPVNKKVVASLRHYELPTTTAANNDDDDDMVELPTSVEAVGFGISHTNWCATGGMDGVLKIWDMNTGQCRHACRVAPSSSSSTADAAEDPSSSSSNGDGGITRLIWHPSLPVIFTSTTNGRVCIWDARSGSMLQMLTGHNDVINDMSIHFVNGDHQQQQQNAVIVTGSDDHTVRVFNVDITALLNQSA